MVCTTKRLSVCRRRSGEISYLHFVKTATIPMVPYVTTLNFHDISNVHVQVRNWRYEISPLRRRYMALPLIVNNSYESDCNESSNEKPTRTLGREVPSEKRISPSTANNATLEVVLDPSLHTGRQCEGALAADGPPAQPTADGCDPPKEETEEFAHPEMYFGPDSTFTLPSPNGPTSPYRPTVPSPEKLPAIPLPPPTTDGSDSW
ncbi:unnamed protein product, partial [Nesidiocoris tenuis]